MTTEGRRSHGTIRVRTTAAALAVVGGVLLLAAAGMLVYLRWSLTSAVRTSAQQQALAVAGSLASRTPEDGIGVGDQEEEFVQVLDDGGEVVASSANLEGRPPVARLAPGDSRRVQDLPSPLGDEDFLAVAVSVDEGRTTVIVGLTLESVTEPLAAVAASLAAGIPLLLLVVGAMTWRVVGRALAPVESMRSEAEVISSEQLHRRLPEPSTRDEVARLAATMNRMLDRLEEGHRQQRQFVSDASHELRSPMAAMRQHAEVARLHPGDTSLDELARVVLEEGGRLQRVVDDLLLLAKVDEGSLRGRRERVDLDDVVFEEAARLRPAAGGVRVDLHSVSSGQVSGDRAHLGRLVANLLDNAARHARSAVAVSLEERADAVVLVVDDDGAGIPPAERGRVFERFVRLEEARDRDSGGSGLGLAIVAEISAAHGAAVRILDSPLGGARAEVRFPLGGRPEPPSGEEASTPARGGEAAQGA